MRNSFNHIRIHTLGLGGLCACLASVYFFGLRPVWQAQQELQAIASEGDNLQSLLPAMETELATLKEQVAAKRQSLATSYSIAIPEGQPWVGVITHLLQERQIELASLREEPLTGDEGTTIRLQINGNYQDLLGLVDDLRRLDSPARINSIQLTPQDESGSHCTALVSVRFFPRQPHSHAFPTT